MTNLKAFNLQDALNGKPIVTRKNIKVKQLHLFENTTAIYPLIVVIEDHGNSNEFVYHVTKEGKFLSEQGRENEYDLFMAPTKKKLWIGIYKNPMIVNLKYNTSYAFHQKEDLLQTMINDNVNKNDFHIIEIEIEIEIEE